MKKPWIIHFFYCIIFGASLFLAARVGVVICIKNSTPPAEITVCSLNFTWE